MKHLKFKFFIVVIFLFVAVAGFYGNSLDVFAAGTVDNLHSQTKIYNSNNTDYFDGCENYADYVNSAPTITVLTHGLGSKAYYWSNDYSISNGRKLAYNSNSLINKIYEDLDGQMTLYLAEGIDKGSSVDFDFELKKYSYEDYINSNDGKPTSVIDDVSKHIVIVFNSSVADSSNYTVYNEFHTILDNISAQYKNLTGVLPRFNLVGHSRGGITNIMYAAEHPYNVASVFSLGTPYSGSALGELEILLGMMGYTDENYVVDNEGVESIMNEEELQNIRNAWNSAYTADVNMNVVAYGSMTSIHLLRALIEDIEVNCEKYEYYGAIINDYSDLINSVINIIDDCPGLTSTTLNFVDGLARIFNDFGIDLFDILFTKINSNLEGKITYEEVRDVLGLVNVINNEIVIMDDLFIDLNSQLGYGFEDGISYNGFKRYTKIFGAADYTDNRAIPEQPGIVHNLEIMNETYMNDIANSLVLGVPTSSIVELSDDFNAAYTFNLGKAFSFTTEYAGTRKFTANGGTITLYQYDANNCAQPIKIEQNTLTYEYDRHIQYLLVVDVDSINNIGVSFSLEDKMGFGDNVVEIDMNDRKVYKMTVSTSGYYLISVSNMKISLSGATYIAKGEYYVYLKANTPKYMYFTNTADYSITVNVGVYEPNEIDLNQSTQITNSSQKVMKYSNPYNSSMAYKLDINWSGGIKYATVYNSNGSTIGSVTTSGTSNTYSFTLGAKQTCYVVYSSIDSSISSNLYINPSQLRWKIDSKVYDANRIQLPRGDTYTIELVVLYNGTIVDYSSPYVNTSSTNFVFSNNMLSISEKALIGYDITIYPTLAPDYLLTVQIGYGNEFSWYVSNGNNVTLSWNVNATYDKINFSIVNSNGTTYPLSKNANQFDITSYLPTRLGTTKIKLNNIVINGITFNNGTDFLNVNDKTVDNLFAGGNGTSSSPYQITHKRHFGNISVANGKYYILKNNLSLGNWTNFFELKGTLDGNDKQILMTSYIDNYVGDMGLFSKNKGTIKNLTLKANISTTVSTTNWINIGGFAGVNEGKIDNCYMESYIGRDNHSHTKSGNTHVYVVDIYVGTINTVRIGGITGYNKGIITNCRNYSSIYGRGDIGGIAGKSEGDGSSTGYIYNSDNYGRIYYLWSSENRSIGGIVGYQVSGTIDLCYNYAIISYDSDKIENSAIKPCMGRIVGHKCGTVTRYNELGEVKTGELFKYDGFLGIGSYNQLEYAGDRAFGKNG
ncbi:MAG: hypothetical protein BHW39_05675 [Firmicutes bacterium CAG:552_39_19]|nr:MAG: hypothetical protein BHW39_05675 [Firmicutes bacterium CAG:552_39_19]